MRKIIILVILIILLQASIAYARAQFRTDSNTVTTRIGNPAQGEFSCPIPNGTITCGSRNVPVNGCGHCGIGYEAYMSNCTYEGINYAMDIAGADLSSVVLPSVDGKIISWTFAGETNNKGNQAIQQFSGTNISTGDKFWLQLHHTAPGSGRKGTLSSGSVGAQICGNGCSMGHVHVEFAKIDPSGTLTWQDAPNFFCRK